MQLLPENEDREISRFDSWILLNFKNVTSKQRSGYSHSVFTVRSLLFL